MGFPASSLTLVPCIPLVIGPLCLVTKSHPVVSLAVYKPRLVLPTYPFIHSARLDNRSVGHKIIDVHLIRWFEVLNSKQLE